MNSGPLSHVAALYFLNPLFRCGLYLADPLALSPLQTPLSVSQYAIYKTLTPKPFEMERETSQIAFGF